MGQWPQGAAIGGLVNAYGSGVAGTIKTEQGIRDGWGCPCMLTFGRCAWLLVDPRDLVALDSDASHESRLAEDECVDVVLCRGGR